MPFARGGDGFGHPAVRALRPYGAAVGLEDSAGVDATLLQRVSRSEAQAFEECVDAYGGMVWALARRSEPTSAEDAVQEIYLDLWRHAGRFDPAQGSEVGFVAMIARRRLIDRRRRRLARPPAEPLAGALAVADPTAPAPQTLAIQAEEARRAEKALARLRPEQRSALRLVLQEGLTYESAARSLGWPLGTLKTHARRGLLELRELLGGNAQTAERKGQQ